LRVGVLLAGCAGGAVIKPPSITAGSKFCTDVRSFAEQAAGLNDAAGETRAQLLDVLPGTVSTLKSLQAEAPAADTVNGKSLKTDIGTMAAVEQDLLDELQTTTDVRSALKAVNAKDGRAMTDATGRFDAYASAVCKVGQATTGTSGAGTSTTAARTGPTGP